MQLPESEVRRRLSEAAVVRLATADAAGRPHIVVSTFAVDGDHIYLAVDQKPKRTRDLKRLRNIRANPMVSVLADHYEDDWTRLWWARADGHADVVSAADGMAAPLAMLAERYTQYRADPPLGPVIAIRVTTWSGWAA